MKTLDFYYELPRELIAQRPCSSRSLSRLMLLSSDKDDIKHVLFRDIPSEFRPGDLLILNDSKVLPARLLGHKPSGAKVDITLSRPFEKDDWYVMAKSNASLREGDVIIFEKGLSARVTGERHLKTYELPLSFSISSDQLIEKIKKIGCAPLPPYIKRETPMPQSLRGDDLKRYQSVFAKCYGSVAAPTAGLHFTKPLLKKIKDRKVNIAFVTLHVGPGTFKPVITDRVEDHVMIPEYFRMPDRTCGMIEKARREKRRIIAVGSTSLRVLETWAVNRENGKNMKHGYTDLFIFPPYKFQVVDGLITNFHLPCSTLFMLVAAFAGAKRIRSAYEEAMRIKYRFYSYGDAMLIWR